MKYHGKRLCTNVEYIKIASVTKRRTEEMWALSRRKWGDLVTQDMKKT